MASTILDGLLSKRASERVVDDLVERASVPNLAALFKAAKQKGLIQEAPHYN